MTKVHPRVGDADMVVHPLHTAVVVDAPALVAELVHRVVDVDPVVLVGEVPLQLVTTVLVDSELVVDVVQTLLHPRLTFPDLVNLATQRMLHSITD